MRAGQTFLVCRLDTASRMAQALKEATCLRYGSCKRVHNLSKAQMEQLWSSLNDNKFDCFSPINSEVRDAPQKRVLLCG